MCEDCKKVQEYASATFCYIADNNKRVIATQQIKCDKCKHVICQPVDWGK